MKSGLGFAKCIKGLYFAKTILDLTAAKPMMGLSLSRSIIVVILLWSFQSFARNQMEAAHNPAIMAGKQPKGIAQDNSKMPNGISKDMSKQPIDIFKESLHPFMQKNCSECHGDNAYYPAGPKHSASEPKIAFEVFTKLLDPNDYKNSRFIKIGSNKHYCQEHKYNCENQDVVNAELNTLFKNYVAAVTVLPKNDVNQNANTHSNADLNWNKDLTHKSNTSFNPMALNLKSAKSPSKSEPTGFILNSNEPTTHSEQIQINNVVLTLTTKVRVFKPDFIKVVHVSLSSHQKIDLTLEGIEIKINDHISTKATGLEDMPRYLSFDGLGIMKTKLTLTREVILKAKAGDHITVKLLGLRTKDLSSIVADCEKDSYAQQVLDFTKPYLPLISSVVYGQEGYGNLNRNQIDETSKRSIKQICSQILLRINKEVPSQSVLVQQLPKDRQADVAQNVLNWVSIDEMGINKIGEIIQTASFGNSFCYALAKDVYCIGDHYNDSKLLRHISVPKGVKKLRIGYVSIAIEDNENNWRFIDLTASLPSSIRNEKSYSFDKDILDLKMNTDLICYLNSENELFCGGYRLNDIIKIAYDNSNFVKMTDIKIKNFYLSSVTIFAIGFDGKIYTWGRLSNFDLDEYKSEINEQLAMFELLLAKDIKDIQIRGDNYVVTAYDNKMYVFSEDISLIKGELEFGENINQGQEISEGLKFTELGYLVHAICGLTAQKELFCRGSLPFFLKYDSGSDYTTKFAKVRNAPKNIKKVMFGSYSMCFLIDTHEITCAGEVSGKLSNGVDNQGRLIFRGGDNPSSYFQAPNIIEPIRD